MAAASFGCLCMLVIIAAVYQNRNHPLIVASGAVTLYGSGVQAIAAFVSVGLWIGYYYIL